MHQLRHTERSKSISHKEYEEPTRTYKQVDVLDIERIEGLLEVTLDVVMSVESELGSDKDLGSGNVAIADGTTDGFLVTVSCGLWSRPRLEMSLFDECNVGSDMTHGIEMTVPSLPTGTNHTI